MHRNKNIIIPLLTLMITLCVGCIVQSFMLSSVEAQQRTVLKEIGWSFLLPEKYDFAQTPCLDNRKTVYRYKREGMLDSTGTYIHPNIAFVIEDVPVGTEVVQFSMWMRRFKVVEMYTPSDSLFSVNAIGHLVEYTGFYEGMEYLHRVYVLHAVQGTKGVVIIFDATESVFEQVKDEFLATMKSLKQSDS